MKAIVYEKFGSPDVLEFRDDEPKPVPTENEVLVKVHASSANPLDWHFMRGKPLFMRLIVAGLLKPKIRILGADFAGVVEAVGSNVQQVKPGDAVFGAASFKSDLGAFAEYVCVDQNKLVHKPENISFEEAACVPIAAVTALQGLQDEGQLQVGQRVLINGASGGVGTYAIQIAKALGAEVTAVCSARNMQQARTLGAEHVIDYSKENFTQADKRYDLIIAANGYHPIKDYLGALADNGRFVVLGGSLKQLFQAMLMGPRLAKKENKHVSNVDAVINSERLQILSELLAAGKVKTIIDKSFPLEQTADAIRYVEAGHAQGKVVITIEGNTNN